MIMTLIELPHDILNELCKRTSFDEHCSLRASCHILKRHVDEHFPKQSMISKTEHTLATFSKRCGGCSWTSSNITHPRRHLSIHVDQSLDITTPAFDALMRSMSDSVIRYHRCRKSSRWRRRDHDIDTKLSLEIYVMDGEQLHILQGDVFGFP